MPGLRAGFSVSRSRRRSGTGRAGLLIIAEAARVPVDVARGWAVTDKPTRERRPVEPLSEDEWIRLHLARAPRMTLAAWRKTVKILEAERRRRESIPDTHD